MLFFILPLKTDVELDHWPWATSGVMVLNVLVAFLFGFPSSMDLGAGEWILRFGEFEPLTWVTSAFLHADVFHLAGNLLFLWVFGMTVEAYVGWRKFLALYVGMAFVEGFLTSLLTLGQSGGALGASGVIWGLNAIAALWAPKCNVSGYWGWVLFVRSGGARHFGPFVVSIFSFSAVFFAWELLHALFTGFAMGSPFLHLLGAGVGAAAGIGMLRLKWVDCDGWDWFSLRARGMTLSPDWVPVDAEPPFDPEATLRQIREHLVEGRVLAADEDYAVAQKRRSDWALPRDDLYRLVQLLADSRSGARLKRRAEELLAAYPRLASAARLAMASHLVGERQTEAAAAQLSEMADWQLDGDERRQRDDLLERIRSQREAGALELD